LSVAGATLRVTSYRLRGLQDAERGRVVGTSLWVAQLIVSESTAQKLAAKHGLDWRDVHDAIVCVRGLRYTWHEHPERGRRALIEIKIGRRWCIAVLYAVGAPPDNVFALGSAYERPKGASW
jgi:hypothetical protein